MIFLKNMLLYLHELKVKRFRRVAICRIIQIINSSIPEKKYRKYLSKKLEEFFDQNFIDNLSPPSFLFHQSDILTKCLMALSWLKMSFDEIWGEGEIFADEILHKWLKEEIASKTFDDSIALIEFLCNVSEEENMPILEIVSSNQMFFRYIMENYSDLNFVSDKKREATKKIVSFAEYKEGRECRA